MKNYKYIHLRSSMDMSGSQALFKLDENEPYEMISQPYAIQDVHYDMYNNMVDAEKNDLCNWYIGYNVGTMLESKLTDDDQERYDEYLQSLEAAEQQDNQEEV